MRVYNCIHTLKRRWDGLDMIKLFKWLRLRTLKQKLIFIFCVISCIVLLIQITVFQTQISIIIKKQTHTYFEETLRQIGKRVELQNEKFYENMESIRKNQVIKNYLNDLNHNRIIYHIAKYKIGYQVLRTPNLETIDNIYIFPPEQAPMNLYYSNAIYEPDEETKQMLKSYSLTNRDEMIWLAQTNPFQVSVLTYIREGSELLGLLRIDLNESFYKQLSEVKLGDKGSVYLVKDEVITFAKDLDWVNKPVTMLNHVSGSQVEYALELPNWKIIGIVPDDELIDKVSQVNRIFLFMELVFLSAILTFSLVTARLILKPLKELVKGMEHIQQGKLDVNLANNGDDEFSVINRHFNYMVERVDNLIKTVYYHQLNYRKTEIMNLQSKLDPHFLYNTLDMIYWSAIVKDEEEIGEAILALSNILRYSISHKNEFVSVAEDMSQLDNYLKIQKMRFENKLEYVFDIEKDIMEVKIPRLLIQPLLENAIKYAFENMKLGGKITINGFAEGDDIYFQVMDNGVGMSEEQVRVLLDKRMEAKSGIGIHLIQQRIQYTFGDTYGLHIESEKGKGTKVTIHLNKNTNFLHEDYVAQYKDELG